MTYLFNVTGSNLETCGLVFSRPILIDCFLVGLSSVRWELGGVWPEFCLMWTDTVPLLSITRLTLPDLEVGLRKVAEESLLGLVVADLLLVSTPPISRTVT